MTVEQKKKLEEELTDLDGKISRLDQFIKKNPIYLKLEVKEQELMRDQLSVMKFYKDCLSRRILMNGGFSWVDKVIPTLETIAENAKDKETF